MPEIAKVAVVGAGVMGAGIAAQVANAGVPVVLLDIVPGAAAAALEAMRTAEPAPFMSKTAARLVTPGTMAGDLDLLADCDWIIEAVVERREVKRALYETLDAVRKPGSVVSSNTSTIPLAQLVDGLPERFARDFLVTHFFNPPRYMRLLELVAGPRTRLEAVEAVSGFADHRLGKSVVPCRDRPGFIANRLGVFWLQAAVVAALDLGLAVEEVDALIGRPMGIPRTGVFGLLDLVGLDLMPQVTASLAAALSPSDAFHAWNRPLPLVERMIAEGLTGRKGRGGFYRLNRDLGGRREAIDLATGGYRERQPADIPALAEAGRSLKALLEHDSVAGRYAWTVLGSTLAYAAGLVGDAADGVAEVDEAMRLGYNWKFGPFELIDQLGSGWVTARLEAEGRAVPLFLRVAAGRPFHRVRDGRREILGLDGEYRPLPRPEGVLLLEDVKRTAAPLLKNGSAALWDIGDGVVCFEFTARMNTLDPDVLDLLNRSIAAVTAGFRALVIYNEGANFSVGANLGLGLFAANIAAWDEIEKLVAAGQATYRALKYAPFPVVAAPSGLALGGGCEILLHADAVQAHAETYAGLVETGVGLIPAWGGCTAMLQRWAALGRLPNGPMPAAMTVFELVGTAKVAKSAAEARDMLILRPGDGITMNRARLLADAKAAALRLAETYRPPEPPAFVLPGPSGRLAMDMAAQGLVRQGKATPHDAVVAEALAEVLSGGATDPTETLDEAALLALERRHFMRLIRHPATLARIEHMLETGKPLRN